MLIFLWLKKNVVFIEKPNHFRKQRLEFIQFEFIVQLHLDFIYCSNIQNVMIRFAIEMQWFVEDELDFADLFGLGRS